MIMKIETRGFPAGELRASDADRDLAIAELSEHFQTGRLTQEEFDERTAQALQARTGRELTELFADLPSPAKPGGGADPVGRGGEAGSGWAGPSWTGPSWTGPTAPVAGRLDRSVAGRPAGPVIVGVAAAIVIASVLGGVAHASFGWLIPLLIVALIIRRAARRH
jgi:Domain of unknown function (DUF1707)